MGAFLAKGGQGHHLKGRGSCYFFSSSSKKFLRFQSETIVTKESSADVEYDISALFIRSLLR